tara:strand:+ start:231 stop:506 length:276 start_codon:yes stop_codon:yes gene_type:complete
MYILTVYGKENEGAYSVQDDEGNHVLYLFEEEDDATRYATMLEDSEYPEMHVIEVEPDMMIGVCEQHGYEYAVITKNDIVIPPTTKHHDFI